MTTILRGTQAAIESVYEDVRPLVEWLASRFVRQYGGDRDDVLGDANLLFLKAYHSYDSSRGSLEKRVSFVVWRGLLDTLRKRIRLMLRMPATHCVLDRIETHDPVPYEDNTMGLSNDARHVANLITNSTPELDDEIRKTQPGADSIRICLRRYLMERLGWEEKRVVRTFRELRELLS